MTDRPTPPALETVELVRILPTRIWIEDGICGERAVMVQHDGCDPFEYAIFGYDYRYTSNAGTWSAANALAKSLGAVEPIDRRHRGFPAPAPQAPDTEFGECSWRGNGAELGSGQDDGHGKRGVCPQCDADEGEFATIEQSEPAPATTEGADYETRLRSYYAARGIPASVAESAIAMHRAEVAAPATVAQEPVAWQYRKFSRDPDDTGWGIWHTVNQAVAEFASGKPDTEVRALYATPSSAAPGQGAQDTARLDWLQTNRQTVYLCTHQERVLSTSLTARYETRLVNDGWAVADQEVSPTIRAAIDAAMSLQPAAPEGGNHG